IAPGYITTELTDVLSEELRGELLKATPLARLGDPEDIARAVRFLVSDDAAFITGAVLQVDGGMGMEPWPGGCSSPASARSTRSAGRFRRWRRGCARGDRAAGRSR